MSETNTATNDYQPIVPVHKGGGVWVVGEKEVKGKDVATRLAGDLNKVFQNQHLQSQLAPRNPVGFKSTRDTQVVYRDNLRELPMNETHTPDGRLNPQYDNEYYYAWASYNDRGSVANHQAKGYRLLSMDELEDLISRGKCPESYLNVLREEGSYLVFGTDILMRIPRLHREQSVLAERKQRATEIFDKVDRKAQQSLTDAGANVHIPKDSNSVTVNFR